MSAKQQILDLLEEYGNGAWLWLTTQPDGTHTALVADSDESDVLWEGEVTQEEFNELRAHAVCVDDVWQECK